METLLALLVGLLFAGGVFLMLERSLLRFAFGVILLSNAVNLLVFAAGRVAVRTPPLLGEGGGAEPFANPVPQALVLTAIVIGFGLVAFLLTLVARGWDALGTMDADRLADGDEDDDPVGASPEGAGIPAPPASVSRAALREVGA